MLEIMTIEDLYKEIKTLPPAYQREIEDFVGYLKMKIGLSQDKSKSSQSTNRVIGIGKGKGWMADDFNSPLDDLKDYM